MRYVSCSSDQTRLQTRPACRGPSIAWHRQFSFPVLDIHSELGVAVRDSDRGENLGRLVIPLLSIQSNRPTWFRLKDKAH